MSKAAHAVVDSFAALQLHCEHYQGVKETSEQKQCTHPENEDYGSWCGLDCCPLVRECARDRSLGWD